MDEAFDRAPMPITLMLQNFDINRDFAAYNALLASLAAGPMSTENGMQPMSAFGTFCYTKAAAGTPCGPAAGFTSADVAAFLQVVPVFARDIKLPATAGSVLPSLRMYYPMTTHASTEDSMDALEATNAIVDASALDATAFGQFFPVFSMFQRIDGLLYASLGTALAVAFLIMLLSLPIHVSLIIGIIVVMVDMDLMAAIYWQGNNLAPFSFAAVVISVGLSLDYAIHVAQEFLLAEGTGNERARDALSKVGRAVFNGCACVFVHLDGVRP